MHIHTTRGASTIARSTAMVPKTSIGGMSKVKAPAFLLSTNLPHGAAGTPLANGRDINRHSRRQYPQAFPRIARNAAQRPHHEPGESCDMQDANGKAHHKAYTYGLPPDKSEYPLL